MGSEASKPSAPHKIVLKEITPDGLERPILPLFCDPIEWLSYKPRKFICIQAFDEDSFVELTLKIVGGDKEAIEKYDSILFYALIKLKWKFTTEQLVQLKTDSNPYAFCSLGIIYMFGMGVPRTKALGSYYLFLSGITQAYWIANLFFSDPHLEIICSERGKHYSLVGYAYLNGEGVSRNYNMAIRMFLKDIENGNPLGFYNMGRMYKNGIGVPQDYKTAVRFFKKAPIPEAIKALRRIDPNCELQAVTELEDSSFDSIQEPQNKPFVSFNYIMSSGALGWRSSLGPFGPLEELAPSPTSTWNTLVPRRGNLF